MKRSIAVFALLGGIWMALVVYKGWIFLALVTNYPGMFAAGFVQYRGIAPSAMIVWMFNVWLVCTSALEWALIAWLVLGLLRRFRRHSDA